MGLFTECPRALIVVGDADQPEREIAALERALEYDGFRGRIVWAKDAVQDILVKAGRVRNGGEASHATLVRVYGASARTAWARM